MVHADVGADTANYTLAHIFARNSAASSLILYDWIPPESVSSGNPPLVVAGGQDPVPKEFTLSENYPNPFNPTTTIEFTVHDNGRATLKVYNIVGQLVAELFNGETQAGKIYREKFDAFQCRIGNIFQRASNGQPAACSQNDISKIMNRQGREGRKKYL